MHDYQHATPEKTADSVAPTPWPWRIATLAGFVGMLGWAILDGSDLDTFLDYPSMAIAILCPVMLILCVFGWRGVCGAFATFFSKHDGARDVENATACFRLGAAFALVSGFSGTLIGLIKMLANMEDPSSIGAGMAVALLTQFYGVFIAILCCAMAVIVERRRSPHEARRTVARQSLPAAAVATAVGVTTALLAFCIILASVFTDVP